MEKRLSNFLAAAAVVAFASKSEAVDTKIDIRGRVRGRPGNRGNRSRNGATPIVRRRTDFEQQVDSLRKLNRFGGRTTNLTKVRREVRLLAKGRAERAALAAEKAAA